MLFSLPPVNTFINVTNDNMMQMNTMIKQSTIVYINKGMNLIHTHQQRKGIQIMTGIADTLYKTHITVTTDAPNNIIMNSNGLLRIATALTTRPMTGTQRNANK
jgi:hypothetical protein